jgi:hypothetical protein
LRVHSGRAVSALAIVLIAVAACAGRALAAAPTPVRVLIDRAPVSSPLPGGFLGIALEYRTIPQWLGSIASPTAVDPALLGLVRGLNPTGRPVIRVGGQSTDRSWWPVPGVTAPVGVTYAITRTWTADAHALAKALDARMLLSVNLEANSLQDSGYEARQLLAGVGAPYVNALEIGNEPDLYTTTPWYRVLNGQDILWSRQSGQPVYSRVPGYDEADYLAEFQRTLAVMPADVAIAGPDAVDAGWLDPFSGLVTPHGRIRILDSHAYALLQCVRDPFSPRYPSIPNLLAYRAWHNLLNGAFPALALAHREGLQFRIDEMGSVSCDGRAGVSDTMASALWATNALFFAAREGVNGVNLHSYPNSTNGLFDLSHTATGWRAEVHPLYDGALMFARADPVGSRVLTLTDDASPTLQTWATIGSDHRVRVLVDNEGPAAQVSIHAPKGFGDHRGSVQRLLAPSAAATSGLTIGGSSFVTSSTGVAPTPVPASATPGRSGYTINAPADSETLLTLSPRDPSAR